MKAELVASRLTPNLPAGIATLGIRGTDVERLVLQLAKLRVARLAIGRIHYGEWELLDAAGSRLGWEQVVVCRVSEHVVEVHCHGGNAVCKALLHSLENAGCRILREPWFEKMQCPIQQAAREDLLKATTDRVAAVLLDQHHGALSNELREIADLLVPQTAQEAAQRLEVLLSHSELGLHLTVPWRVVLAGPPNVGKSSLLNRLVGQARAIVHEEAGTTRDWLESQAVIDGWPIALTDTAGLRETEEEIEREGVRRAHQKIRQADLVVLVVDGAQGVDASHVALASNASGKVMVAWNKADLRPCPAGWRNDSQLAHVPDLTLCETSAAAEPGIDALAEAIVERLIPVQPDEGQPMPFRLTQVEAIRRAFEACEAGTLEVAQHITLQMLGDR